ncbi:MAG TPA: glycosyltransferase family 2 protein [Bryobacteraceae bacterium]|jgi:N-acetylglucosaminyl-diphospho-decaprenol L-rhamnosyltransferase|nr:glycosyltransferase family 2 protein [Bryobacteraceae bacterium]
MNRTGVVIVTYNSAQVIERCLDSCAHLLAVVIDNASQDNTVELVRRRSSVKLIANPSNRGFAGAANQGVAALDAEMVLLLNPDVQLETPVDPLAEACSQENVGLATGKLLDSQGKVQIGFTVRRLPTPLTLVLEVLGINRVLPWNPSNRRYRCLDLDLTKPAEVEQPPGAFLMFRREVWQRLGGFDTQFDPLWFEDVDFVKRARSEGFKIQYLPEVTARHRGGHSIAGMEWGCREVCWYVSLLRYASKHFRPYAYRGVSAAVVLGSLFRAMIGMIRRRSLRPIQVYAKIARVAVLGLISGHVGKLECSSSYSKTAG